ncbi:hypothetical protein [Cohnella thailandensis]|uniref:Uncharacterized protein n=1 Tax=Cohnella thailandensis TaxID=557557 RepID=A0A841SNQ7_9BACL|nr:hypothetical protein [Cohnella thailandensis]MBB6634083.1 hypothetical protein [Cohnella thailandensis]MBP1972425.1 hypothetical protein [Cohnella thailandensis]
MKPSVLPDAILELAARLSQLKEDHYRQLVVLDSLIELLVEKGILSPDELSRKAEESEAAMELEAESGRSASSS